MNFDTAVSFILKAEGGYVNDPKDPGGETKYGISKRSYPDIDIKNLTKGHAKHIYERDYWMAMKCPGLPHKIRLAVFDGAVNQGRLAATLDLQDALGVAQDGIIGDVTLNAAANFDQLDLLNDFLQNRLVRYLKTKNFDRFGRGWLSRLVHVAVVSNQ